ncbi:hypothetical protein GIB67_006856 [Kingdonia uniflora]|uniref:ABC transporter domain-containing protein n=1 Tax=Kingdonia uniflora TaxID=39325 RepID=A0A7J7L0A6_9MAGN|nr:hypothetical protein GIB67_006856 [Kingdonia uniflora]
MLEIVTGKIEILKILRFLSHLDGNLIPSQYLKVLVFRRAGISFILQASNKKSYRGYLCSKWFVEMIKYRPNAPLVLKGITCTFKEGTRVGVVRRTGSEKTTLISALFCFVEPMSGRILIDGLDICSIGLRDLRLKLSIIPPKPTLF